MRKVANILAVVVFITPRQCWLLQGGALMLPGSPGGRIGVHKLLELPQSIMLCLP
jgi:hypothetical protein